MLVPLDNPCDMHCSVIESVGLSLAEVRDMAWQVNIF
jgi:hypothetical protein